VRDDSLRELELPLHHPAHGFGIKSLTELGRLITSASRTVMVARCAGPAAATFSEVPAPAAETSIGRILLPAAGTSLRPTNERYPKSNHVGCARAAWYQVTGISLSQGNGFWLLIVVDNLHISEGIDLPTERDSTAPEPAIESGERAAREAAGVHDSPAPLKDHHDTFPAPSEPTVAEGAIGNFYFKRYRGNGILLGLVTMLVLAFRMRLEQLDRALAAQRTRAERAVCCGGWATGLTGP
jgi:hypothetical protein